LVTAVLSDSVKSLALDLGFDAVGIGPADPPEHGAEFERWIAAGHAGGMAYLARRRQERLDPDRVLPGARSVVAVALSYYQGDVADVSWTPVARYAWGRDYHDVIAPRLERLAAHLEEACGARSRAYVDTGPVLERDLSARAGLGWIGKNTMLLHPHLGSWFFIGVLLTTAELEHDAPLPDRCGRCRACLDACPTGAFAAPYVLDARRCISYLTIEHRGPIDESIAAEIGDWQFGCDICQSVCPWNRKAPETGETAFLPSAPFPGARAVVDMTDEELRERFRHTALWRSKPDGLRRNARLALANAQPRAGDHTPDPTGEGTQ
jgi:epoxyqueuosine reductase